MPKKIEAMTKMIVRKWFDELEKQWASEFCPKCGFAKKELNNDRRQIQPKPLC